MKNSNCDVGPLEKGPKLSGRGQSEERSHSVVTSSSSRIPPITTSSPNPFTLPPDEKLFILGDEEKKRKAAHKALQRGLNVRDKTTFSQQMKTRTMPVRKISPTQSKVDKMPLYDISSTSGPRFMHARDRHLEKDDLKEYVAKRREMFLVQYMLQVKKEEIGRLDQVLKAEEGVVKRAEKFLEEDAQHLAQFSNEVEKASDVAHSRAIEEERAKLDMIIELQKKKIELYLLKTDLSKVEYKLEELVSYKNFLNNLAPQSWNDERTARHLARKEEYLKKKREENPPSPSPTSAKTSASKSTMRTSSRVKIRQKRRLSSVSEVAVYLMSMSAKERKSLTATDSQISLSVKTTDSDYESDDSCELFFTDPQQLLNIFAELEEQNLSLIQNNQETEEALDEMNQTTITTKNKMNQETDMLKSQMDALRVQIVAENERSTEYEHRAKMFSYGKYNKLDQEKMLQVLNDEVEKVYNSCIGENEANISTLQMLTYIENRLEELFEHIETMPQWKLNLAEKAKSKERRQKLKEKKLKEQKLLQEERVARALERAQADRKIQTGKKLVFRSRPPEIQKEKINTADSKKNDETEELAYYFEK